MAVLEDVAGDMTFTDVLAASDSFVAMPGLDLNPGYTATSVWVRLSVRSDDTRTMLLSLTPTFVDFVDVYAGRAGAPAEAFVNIAMGDHRPLPTDYFSGLDNVVRLDLVAGAPAEVYVRLNGVNSAIGLSAELHPAREHTMRTTTMSLAYGGWFGGMAVLIVVQLVFFSFDRRPVYLLVASSTFAAMMVYAGTAGLSRFLVFPQGGIGNDHFTALSVWVGQIVTSLAAASVLDLKARSRWTYRVLQCSVLIGCIGIVFALSGHHIAFAPIGSLSMVLVASIVLVKSIRLARGQGLEAWLKAAAYLVLWLGLVLTLAQRTGVLNLANWVGHSYALSNLTYTLLLTGAMAVRLRVAETLNRTMQAEALVAAQAAQQHADRMVADRTRELAEAKRQAEDALEAELASQQQQVRFMEVISHQYRTPLAGLRSNIESIGLSLSRADAANHERLERVRRSIVRLVEVLEINLARSRLQGSAFQPSPVPLRLAPILEATAARAADLTQHPVTVDVAPDADDTRILADADMLGIAIINLLENAVKFSGGGDRLVVLALTRTATHALIAVIDRGIGIPENEIAGIFGRSVRGSNVEHVPGTGAGLSLVSRIVSAHGGTVALESALGEGTTVRISLPLAV